MMLDLSHEGVARHIRFSFIFYCFAVDMLDSFAIFRYFSFTNSYITQASSCSNNSSSQQIHADQESQKPKNSRRGVISIDN